jgi:hypothetical protein
MRLGHCLDAGASTRRPLAGSSYLRKEFKAGAHWHGRISDGCTMRQVRLEEDHPAR